MTTSKYGETEIEGISLPGGNASLIDYLDMYATCGVTFAETRRACTSKIEYLPIGLHWFTG